MKVYFEILRYFKKRLSEVPRIFNERWILPIRKILKLKWACMVLKLALLGNYVLAPSRT